MHFFRRASSASPSPPSSGRAHSNQERVSGGGSCSASSSPKSPDPFRVGWPRLMRQRKFRHVSDWDVGPSLARESRSSPASPDSRSPPPAPDRRVLHWSSAGAANPLPLPLPESCSSSSPSCRAQAPYLGQQFTNDGGPPSSREEGAAAAREPLCPIDDKPSFGCAIANPSNQKTRNHIATELARFSSTSGNGLPHDQNGGRAKHRLTLKVPVWSAPTTSLSSPAISPRRSSSEEIASPSHAYPSNFEFRSGPESLRSFPVKMGSNRDHSPLHSPRVDSKANGAAAFPMHHKLLPEGSAAWPEISGHRLPLPPGSITPPPPTATHHATEKPNVSAMKSQWQKGRLIGRGTFGSVYVATNRETGASCAMKKVDIIPDDSKSAECMKQLEQEIKVLHQLKHPNIVQYYGSEIVDDHFYIYMEYVHPGSINKFVRENYGTMTESVVRNFTRHILSGLAYLHSKNTIHRDIKGANLLVDAKGVVKLADFGMAKLLTGQADVLSLKGSPYWMAPEILQASMRNDTNPELAFAVDIWSLGCTVIEMLNGKPPWGELPGVAAMFKALHRTPPIPETSSLELKDFLQLCFQRAPEERPSASKLLEHPFVRNSHEQNVSLGALAFSGATRADKPQSPRERAKNIFDLPLGSSGRGALNGHTACFSDVYNQSYAETSNSAPVPHHLPHLLPDYLASPSRPLANNGSQSFDPPYLGVLNFQFSAAPRT